MQWECYFWKITRERSEEMRKERKAIKASPVFKEQNGSGMAARQRYRALRRFIYELHDNSFAKHRAMALARRDELMEKIDAVTKTKPYDWETGKKIHEEIVAFVTPSNYLDFFENASLLAATKKL